MQRNIRNFGKLHVLKGVAIAIALIAVTAWPLLPGVSVS